MQEQKWSKCPHCGAYAEKKNGCNFLYCSSPICKEKGYFCYLCGDKLTEAVHISHFMGAPFGNNCLTLQVRA
jgi:hypothetical protein